MVGILLAGTALLKSPYVKRYMLIQYTRLSMDFKQKQSEDRLKVIEKKLKYIGLYNAPAMIVIALGLFSKFVLDPGALHPLLADANVVNNALILAVPWAIYNAYKATVLSLEANKIKAQ